MNLSPAWRLPLLTLLALLALAAWAQTDAVQGMAQLWWRSDTFAHGMLVPPIALWLAWRKRAELALLCPRPDGLGFVALVLAVAAAWLGAVAEVNALQHMAVVFTLQAVVLLILGRRVAKVLAFPLLFLLFAPPFGDFLVEPMMIHTADFVVGALRIIGIPVYREGLHFMIPSGPWSVVEACSGLRYLFASAMVGTLYAYLSFSRWPRRLAFVAVSLVVPVVANWVRALLIVLLGHYSDNRLATGADHLIYGWVFFGIVMMLMFWIGNRWADSPATARQPAAVAAAAAPVGLLHLLLSAALAVPVLVAPQALTHLKTQAAPPADAERRLAALAPEGWEPAPSEWPWSPQFVGGPAHIQSAWRSAVGEPEVLLDIAFYPAQTAESKAVNSMNEMVPAQDARWARQGAGDAGQRWSLRVGARAGESVLAQRYYWVDGSLTPSATLAKLRGVRQLLLGRGDAQAVVVVMSAEQRDGVQRLQRFVQALEAPLNERLTRLAQRPADHNSGR